MCHFFHDKAPVFTSLEGKISYHCIANVQSQNNSPASKNAGESIRLMLLLEPILLEMPLTADLSSECLFCLVLYFFGPAAITSRGVSSNFFMLLTNREANCLYFFQ